MLSTMINRRISYLFTNSVINIQLIESVGARFNGGRKFDHLTPLYRIRQYSKPAWQRLLVPVPRPVQKTASTPRSSQLVPLEDRVDKSSLICLEDINNANSAAGIFQAFRRVGSPDINEVHIARAITQLAKIMSSAPQEDSKENMLTTTAVSTSPDINNNADFVHLCYLVLRYLKDMDPELFMEVLDAVIDLRVPQNSVMIQTLLASTEYRLNRLTFRQLSQLAHTLCRLEKSDQRVNALLQAISLHVPDKINKCFKCEHMSQVLFTIGKRFTHQTHANIALRMSVILNARLEQTGKVTEKLVLEAVTAVKSFAAINYQNLYFLEESCKIILSGIEFLTVAQLSEALCSISRLEYCDLKLLERAGHYIADRIHECTLDLISRILNSYSSQRFLHKKLFKSAEEFVIENEVALNNQENMDTLVGILSPFAMLLHHDDTLPSSVFYELIKLAAERTIEEHRNDDIMRYLYLTTLLAMCGVFSPGLTEIALSRSCWETVLNNMDIRNLLYLQLLHAIVCIDKPTVLENVLNEIDMSDRSQRLDRITRTELDLKSSKIDKLRLSVSKVIHKEICNQRGYSMDTDVVISHGYAVDFLLRDTTPGIKPAIAIDVINDSSRFLANFPHTSLNTENIKRRHLASLGYTHGLVRDLDWMSLPSDEDKASYILRIKGVPSAAEP